MVSLSAVGLEEENARQLVERHRGPVSELELEAEPLRGGLEAAAVGLVTARFSRPDDERRHLWRWVVKHLPPGSARELAVHRRLDRPDEGDARFVPELLATETGPAGEPVLHLEWIRPWRRWPWRDLAVGRETMRRFAGIHRALDRRLTGARLPAWDYETELARSARATVEMLERLPRTDDLRPFRRTLPAARRIVAALPRVRRELLGGERWGGAFIHGDLHPSNVVVRTRNRQPVPILLDWGRARRGSALEDLSSWMLSLAHWEPRVARRHDRLLRDYLEAAGAASALDSSFRDAYWLAGASNALAGALRYQLVLADGAGTERQREEALAAAAPWARALRRADQRWRAAA